VTEASRAAGGNGQAAPNTAEPAAGKSAAGGGGAGEERIVVRDKRKIDSGTKAKPARREAAPAAGAPAPADPAPQAATAEAKSAGPAEVTEPAEVAGSVEATEPIGAAASTDVAEGVEVPEPAQVAEVAEAVEPSEPAQPVEVTESAEVVSSDAQLDPGEAPGTLGATRSPALGAELQALRSELAERTDDLQRVTAEYANYRKRVDRDRHLVADQAIGSVLAVLLPILDDLDRAREHGDLTGPFGSVAEQLTTGLGKFGLTPFGEKGDPFDPTRHEAVAHLTSPDVTEPTCVEVLRRGYLLGDRLLRAALVAVADPE
jgi:molecular chaperone GrpE